MAIFQVKIGLTMAGYFQDREPTWKLSNASYHTQMKGTAWNHMTESHLCTLQAPIWGAGFQNVAIFGVKKWPLWRAGLSA